MTAEKKKFDLDVDTRSRVKGHQLRRLGDMLYYGNAGEKYCVFMQILEKRPLAHLEVASKVSVQLLRTDPDLRPRERLVKQSEKPSLYAAVDIAAVWLDRALARKN